jgi:6-pyruvoyltetrahydropterin/6-carboxytetrahydropterin synthase
MHRKGWSAAESERRFGWSAKAPGHGHLYRVSITVTGPVDPETGVIIDLAELDAIIDREVRAPLDGSDLNSVLDEVVSGDAVPGCEVIAGAIWRRVAPALPGGVTLLRVTVAEDDTLEAECTGPG